MEQWSQLVKDHYHLDIHINFIQIFLFNVILAYWGGMVGLFTGFSLITGVEFIYWFTMRPLVDRLRNKKNKTAPEQET